MHEKEASHLSVSEITPQEASVDLVRRTQHHGARFWLAVLILAVLFLGGLIGFALRLLGGFEDRTQWGYFAAAFAFLFAAAQGAPMWSAILRLTKNHWRRPMVRAAELWGIAGILSGLMFIPLLWLLPPLEGRWNLWFDWPVGAPRLWDALAMTFLVILGLALLYATSLPDLAAWRDHPAGGSGLAQRLTGNWQGTLRQWRVLRLGILILGVLYLMFYVFVNLLVSVDLAMSLVPGWRSAIFPAYHALTGIQAGLALTIITAALLRSTGGFREYLGLDQFWSSGKLLLAMSLLWFYFTWSEFITWWYGRTPSEQTNLQLLYFGPYLTPMIIAFLFAFLIPFVAMVINPVRKSIWGPTFASVCMLVGLFFDRVRLYVSAYSVEELSGHMLEKVPATHFPDVADILIIIGTLAGASLIFLLATRVIPVISIWEVVEGIPLRVVRRFLRTRVAVIGRPE